MKLYNLMLRAAIFCLTFSTFSVCGAQSKKYVIKLEKTQSFGKEDGSDDEIIGLPGGLAVDAKGNVYISDYSFKKVKQFSEKGKFIKSFGFGEGQGPGEFMEPKAVDVDLNGNVYVADGSQRAISMFDSTGKYIKRIMTDCMPFSIAAFTPNKIFITGGIRGSKTVKDDVIKQYDFINERAGIINVFGKRYEGKYQKQIEDMDSNGEIVKHKWNNIFYAAPYPYQIKKYSFDGELLNIIIGDFGKILKPILVDHVNNREVFYYGASSESCTFLNDSILINIISKWEKRGLNRVYNQYLDFWDVEKAIFLGRFSEKDLGIRNFSYLKADGAGNIYAFAMEPYFHLSRYHLTLSSK